MMTEFQLQRSQPALLRTGQCELFTACNTEVSKPGFNAGSFLQRIVFTMLLIFGVSAARAQLTTADILGTVTDSTGAVIPGAPVTLRNLATSDTRTAATDRSGNFDFTLLQPGHYSLTVTATGFKAVNTPDLSVEAGDRARSDAHLQPGSSSETVSVEATTPLLQGDNATVSSTVTAAAVQDLPLVNRNFVQLVQLVPGANEGPGNGLTSGGRPDDRRVTAGFSVNGQDDTLNNYVIDGIDNNERIIGTIGVRPNVEGIQEITVETNSYAPEAGRTAGGVVNVVTKSGSNQLHGSVYEYFRNNITDAKPYFALSTSPTPALRQNQFGASIGGPIYKNKTFFYGDYEGFRLISGGISYTSSVPTVAEYDDIHSIGGGTPQQLLNQGNGTSTYAPDPVALNYLMLFPLPNAPGSNGGVSNNYVINPNKSQTSNVFDVRIDHSFNSNNLLYGRYTYNKVNTFTPAQLPVANNSGPLAGIYGGGGRYNFSGPAIDEAQQYELSYTHIFNSNLVVDLKAGYTRINNQSDPLNYGNNSDSTVGFGPNMNFNQFTTGLTPIGIAGFEDLGDGAYVPLQDIDNTFQYLGTVSYTRGNHNIKAGASLIRRQARNVQSASGLGSFSFGLSSDSCAPGVKLNAQGNCINNGNATTAQNLTNVLASLLTGAYTATSRNYDLTPPDYRSWEPSAFVQDSWRAQPKLTLIYGLRYDIFTPFTEAHNHISNFNFALASTAASASAAQAALQVAGVNGVSSTAGIQTIHSDVAPRVGFAYTPLPSTVLRGGYGISYFPGNYTSNADLKNPPFTSNYAPSCNSINAFAIQSSNGAQGINPVCTAPYNTFDAGDPLPAPQTINSPSLGLVAEDPNDKPALVQQYNFQVEQQFGANVLTIGYVGNSGQHLPQIKTDINLPAPSYPQLPRPLNGVLPNVTQIGYIQSEGASNYNSLQTSFQRRLSKGLSFDANYTWAHGLDNVLGFSEEGDQGAFNANPFNTRIDYGNSENDITNRFALSLTYAIPFGQHFNGVRKALLSGWSTNSISVWQTGKPFSIINSSSDGGYQDRAQPNYSPNPDRPNQLHSAVLAHKTLTKFFDTTAFAPQPLGTIGNTERNSLFGPHFRHVDLSVFKDFPVTERFKVEFRVESFNISNTPSFFIANTNSGNQELGNPSFGQITQTDPNYTPRQFQFALKILF